MSSKIGCPLFFILAIVCQSALAQPDLSGIQDPKVKISVWISYCDSLRINGQYPVLQQAAQEGLKFVPGDDAASRSSLLFYIGISNYYQVKFDSAQYYFYQSLHQAQEAGSAKLITNACEALIPLDYQLQQPDKVDSCKNILQRIIDTIQNEKILQDGYSALGSYYQQKSYYSTAQDYFIKSIELRKKGVDTTKNIREKLDYAIQCYTLYKLYNSADMTGKGLSMLNEGRRYMELSPLVYIRYLSSFVEAFTMLGNIDSAMFYMRALQEHTRNAPTVPSEAVTSNLNIAQYYIGRQQYVKALPYVQSADTLAARSHSPILLYQAQMMAGRYFQETGQYQQAITALTQSLPVARQISKEQYADDLKFMALAQQGAGNALAALQYYQQYVQQIDTLTKEKISRNLADQETRYETSQKEQRITLLDKDNRLKVLELKNAARIKVLLLIGLIALAVISLLLYFIYRNKERLNKALSDQNETLDRLNRQLAVANHTKARLFGIISHDLRSPVSKIVQFLRLKKDGTALLNDKARQEHEEKLQAASENVLETMEDLLLWSKSQMEHFAPQMISVNITDIIIKEIQLLDPLIQQHQILVKYAPEKFYQQTDENFASIIIRNLLQNAIKSSPDGDEIDIYTQQNSLYITNTSLTIKAGDLNNKLSGLSTDSNQYGLGLQIIQDLSKPIHVNILFTQKDTHRITAEARWQS